MTKPWRRTVEERKKRALSSTMTSQAENYDEGLGPPDVYQRRDCDGVWNDTKRGDHPLKQLEGIGTRDGGQTRRHLA